MRRGIAVEIRREDARDHEEFETRNKKYSAKYGHRWLAAQRLVINAIVRGRKVDLGNVGELRNTLSTIAAAVLDNTAELVIPAAPSRETAPTPAPKKNDWPPCNYLSNTGVFLSNAPAPCNGDRCALCTREAPNV